METFRNAMPLHVNEVFAKHGLNVWVKNDYCFDIFVSCEELGLTTPFVGFYWGHATNDCKVCVN
jgi:hypothetical protein